MARVVRPQFDTFADVLRCLGGIAPDRVHLRPAPGEAAERDLLYLLDHGNRLYELVDRTIVEKVSGSVESYLAMELAFHLRLFLQTSDLGILLGPDGPYRLRPSLVRLPDVSFLRWERLPMRDQVPTDPICRYMPNLAIEVLSPGNTRKEMVRKRQEYFQAGVQRVWYVDPVTRTVTVYTAADLATVLGEKDTLDGGDLLPGFAVPVRDLFARVPSPPKKRRKR
ncbi:MAG: Uma2 family endonuclease [Gemmataceae bacterium]